MKLKLWLFMLIAVFSFSTGFGKDTPDLTTNSQPFILKRVKEKVSQNQVIAKNVMQIQKQEEISLTLVKVQDINTGQLIKPIIKFTYTTKVTTKKPNSQILYIYKEPNLGNWYRYI